MRLPQWSNYDREGGHLNVHSGQIMTGGGETPERAQWSNYDGGGRATALCYIKHVDMAYKSMAI